jgi:hypothetical protein
VIKRAHFPVETLQIKLLKLLDCNCRVLLDDCYIFGAQREAKYPAEIEVKVKIFGKQDESNHVRWHTFGTRIAYVGNK